MNINHRFMTRLTLLITMMITLTVASIRMQAACNPNRTPFIDLNSVPSFLCSAIAEAYFSGLMGDAKTEGEGTSFGPNQSIDRQRASLLITHTQDSALKRGNRRAALQQWWTPAVPEAVRPVPVGSFPVGIVCDGSDVWIANNLSNSVTRIQASNGQTLQSWVGISRPLSLIVAAGRIFVTGEESPTPGRIYSITPETTGTIGTATVFADNLGINPNAITFDGTYLWTANSNLLQGGGSISRVRISDGVSDTFTTGFVGPLDIIWDGATLWVLDNADRQLKMVNPANGKVVGRPIEVESDPYHLLFDGTNLWVTSLNGNTVTVVRAVGSSRGIVLATLTGNGLNGPRGLAFDGDRVLVVNQLGGSVSLFKATDFSLLGTVSIGAGSNPYVACSDGVNFWIIRTVRDDVVRF